MNYHTDQSLLLAALAGRSKNGGVSGGASNYNDLKNQPQINGVTLTGNKSSADLGISEMTEEQEEQLNPFNSRPHKEVDSKHSQYFFIFASIIYSFIQIILLFSYF